ncbi:magnesium/cobalt transporter CorA [Bacillus fonticola]|uniref:magnesium/cobalt transporter CorA n=1 Tax=Bacillus fonticola TaxID=2728853 RepID=UPI001475A015|nr:magnesium/cobalt transporter CorA [Bacillus fonticola]
MIQTIAIWKDGTVETSVGWKRLQSPDIAWYWVDYSQPTVEEQQTLQKKFRFHPLSVEDCVEKYVQRPKMDVYDGYTFFVFHALHQKTLDSLELNCFVSSNYLVTFHYDALRDVQNVWHKIKKSEDLQRGPMTVLHEVIDRMVDDYFPAVYRVEDDLNAIEDNRGGEDTQELMERLFDTRVYMSKIRRTVLPMRDVLYRMLYTERSPVSKERRLFYQDVYDHLITLVEMLESFREFSADIRDNYLSINSDKMNSIMMTLTVITTIFMPLTFVAGVYGMNFVNMPELQLPYGYPLVLAFMLVIALVFTLFFQRKGWFRIGRAAKQKRKRRVTFRRPPPR